jgi:hypothetical protein
MDPVDGWQFKESPSYLRDLGALDETEPHNSRIIIPNYVNAPGNCFANGTYYQSCCINECEDLQVQIERQLKSSDPEPFAILKVVKKLSSATVKASKSILSPAARNHLWQIADMHEGRVPLQSRLFAQWMHFAFPHECPFPHLSGSKNPTMLNVNSDGQFVTDGVAFSLVQEGKAFPNPHSNGSCMPWRLEEELFVPGILHTGGTSLAALAEDSSVWHNVFIMTSISCITLGAALVFTFFRKNVVKKTGATGSQG